MRVPADDAAALGLRRALASADIHPSSLPTHAILCVRRIADPKPQRLTLDRHALRLPSEWEQSARDAVARVAASAARPALGPVPAGAEAVLFADRAELLACLAHDWSAGLFHACWWWRALFGSHAAAETVLRAFRETPHVVPAAIDTLARAGSLEPFLRRLQPSCARAIAVDVARTFGLDDVELAIAAHGRSEDASAATTNGDAHGGAPHVSAAIPSLIRADARVAAMAPEAFRLQVNEAQLALAVVALVCHRSPILAPSVLAAVMWPRASDPGPSRSQRPAPGPSDRSSDSASVDVRAVEDAQKPFEPTSPRTPMETGGARIDHISLATPQPAREKLRLEGENQSEGGFARQPIDTPQVIETAFGGAFYLLNVATALGLYADFAAPKGPNLPIPVWDFLAVVADRLGGPGFGDDPLSALFAVLAGRAPDQPIPRRHPHVRRVRRLVPSLRRRIAGGLGVHPNIAGPLLVTSRARVLVAPATIEVRFTLAELPIEVRLAGLDRDPGFVPAAARTMVFTYA